MGLACGAVVQCFFFLGDLPGNVLGALFVVCVFGHAFFFFFIFYYYLRYVLYLPLMVVV